MHKTLERQIIEHFGSLTNIPPELMAFVQKIDRTYRQVESDRSLDGEPFGESPGVSGFRQSIDNTP